MPEYFLEPGHEFPLPTWCHKHLPEYEELKAGRKPITLKKIADAVGVDPNLIKEEAQAASFLANAFA